MTSPRPGISRATRRRAAFLGLAVTAFVGATVSAETPVIALPPDAELVRGDPPDRGGHALATAPWTGQTVPTRSLSGAILRETWRIPGASISVQELASDLAGRIASSDFDILLACHASECGGFDFTAGMDLGPSPEMYVDIGNFSYISAAAPDAEAGVAITVSASGPTLYVHAVQIAPAITAPLDTSRATRSEEAPGAEPGTPTDMTMRIARLPDLGAVTLDDLSFTTGASDLSGRDYPSLVALAEFLADNPGRRIVLVGHTDSEGSLEGNVRLSEERARAVRRHLVESLGVDPARVSATGIGYLAPRASNDTPAGREANRRVEAVLLGSP